jgi:hypothetical protein
MDIQRVSQRTISAADAPPAAAPGAVSSPFAAASQYLGGRRAPAGEQEREEAPAADQAQASAAAPAAGKYLLPLARKVLESCGALTEEQLAEGMGIDLVRVRKVVKNALGRKVFQRSTDAQGRDVVQITPPRGLKSYVAKRGDTKGAAAKPAAKRKTVSPRENGGGKTTKRAARRQARPARELPAPVRPSLDVVPAAAAAAPPEPVPEFACGLLNTGVLVLEIEGKETRLKKQWVRDLVAYLDRIGSGAEGVS